VRRHADAAAPAWARDEPVSPPATPHSRPSHAIEREPSDLGLPQASGAQGQSWSGSKALGTHGPSRSTADSDDDSDANDERGPTRFWTFTLPAKYRARLHEHHMRMVHTSQSEPQRDEDASSDTSSTLDQGEHDPAARQRARRRGTETGKGSAPDPPSGGLMGWRRLSHRPKDHSADVEAAAGAEDDDVRDVSPDARRSEAPQTPENRREPGREQSSRSQQQVARASHESSASRDSSSLPAAHMHAEMPTPHHIASFTRHQPHTPGWESPWRPESRDGGSIEVGGYRFGAHGGFFPASKEGKEGGRKKEPPFSWWRNFLLHNPFVPLLFRLLNIAFTTATMAVAICLHNVLNRESAADSVGSSPLVAIIYAPPTLMHVGFQIYLEYFGKPIGLWSVKSKLYYTLVDLIFICMWSSELSLTFDNYLTSSLVCDAAINPFASNANAPDYQVRAVLRQLNLCGMLTFPLQSPLQNPTTKPNICRLQGALIGLVFVSLLAYLVVLTVRSAGGMLATAPLTPSPMPRYRCSASSCASRGTPDLALRLRSPLSFLSRPTCLPHFSPSDRAHTSHPLRLAHRFVHSGLLQYMVKRHIFCTRCGTGSLCVGDVGD
jgi:hypothetical protein